MLNKVVKIVGIVLAGVIVLAVTGYMAVAYHFRYRYPAGTYINNVDVRGLDVRNANELLLKKYMPGVDYSDITLMFEGPDGYNETVRGSDIGLKADMTDALNNIMAEQKPYEWLMYYLYPVNYSAEPVISYDSDRLYEAVNRLKCIDETDDKKDPVIEIRSDSKGYYLYDEIVDKADADKVVASADAVLDNIETSVLEIDIGDCYIEHTIPAGFDEVVSLYDRIDKIANAEITFFDDGIKQVLKGSTATAWLEKGEDGLPYFGEDGNLVFDESKIEGYTDSLSDTFDTTGGELEWNKFSGGTVKLKNQLMGYKVDKTAEAAQIKEELLRGDVRTRRPLYETEGRGRGKKKDAVGDTYIEVDMSAQKLYYFADGVLELTSDVVTGNIKRGNGTPSKACYVYFKQRNRTLRGENYATFVNYWMAVTGHVGIHDATWRSKFGGDIYKTNGSHGCINVPKAFAAQLYEVVEEGTPCILYY